MRADRLVSLVLLLRQRGRMSAPALAAELEVSVRTVLRDVEALSAAGVPVYAERGRRGGFALLPGFRTELTGLSQDEAIALLATSTRAGHHLGLGAGLAAAVRKVVDAVPGRELQRAEQASRRFLIEPEADLLARRQDSDIVPVAVMAAVRRAVIDGRRVQVIYLDGGGARTTRTVDPLGLVTSRGGHYLLATRDGEERTYRLSRIQSAVVLTEPAQRPEEVDLVALWRERSERFRAGNEQVTVHVRVGPDAEERLLATAVCVLEQEAGAPGTTGEAAVTSSWSRLRVTFQDARHARWAVWTLGGDVEILDPPWLRTWLRERARVVLERHGDEPRPGDDAS